MADEGASVGFDLGDLDDGMLDELDEALIGAGIARGWEDAVTLVVAEDDADRVEELLNRLEYPDELPIEAAADEDLVEVLSAWFVAADTLARDPGRAGAAGDLVAALRVAEGRPAPFGVPPDLWESSRQDASQLVTMVVDEGHPDEIQERARRLRLRLRPIV